MGVPEAAWRRHRDRRRSARLDALAVAVTDHGLLETHNEGRSWRPAAFGDADVVTWAPDGALYGVSRGAVRRAQRGIGAGQTIGELDGPIVALAGGDDATIWALARGGLLSRSSDGGHVGCVGERRDDAQVNQRKVPRAVAGSARS